jgi:hypothetical protein
MMPRAGDKFAPHSRRFRPVSAWLIMVMRPGFSNLSALVMNFSLMTIYDLAADVDVVDELDDDVDGSRPDNEIQSSLSHRGVN